MTTEQINAANEAAGIETTQTTETQVLTQDKTSEQENTEETQQTSALGEGVEQEAENTEDQEGEGENKEDKENELFGKPEAYDYKNVQLPENMELDAEMTGKFNEYAAKLNLSQKGADDLMQMAVELTKQTQQQTVDAIGKLNEAKIEGYRQLLNTDKEVGGARLKESIATANLAYDAFFKDEDLRVMLAESGMTVHPKFIKALKSIGAQMKNDTIHTEGGAAAEKRERQDILYPSMAED